MNRGLKITLIVFGSLAVAGGVAYGVVRYVRKKKEEKENIEKELQETQQLEQINEGLESQQSKPLTDGKIAPIRNLDKVLNNTFSEIKNVKIYPAKKSNDPTQGHPYAEGFANVRETPEVNNESAWYDPFDNLLGKVSAGTSIGTIVSEQYDNMTPKMRWFKVKLTKKLDDKQYGWVRGDNVTFFPFTKKSTSKKKSSFNGNMIEKYNTSYQLGAEVFPHSDWNLYSNADNSEVFQNFDAKQLDINL